MGKFSEYLASCIGYTSDGGPAAIVQFSFGNMPFIFAETESIEKVMQLSSVVQTDAVVDIKIIDDLAKVTFDFSADTENFEIFSKELDLYQAQRERAMDTLNALVAEYKVFTEEDTDYRKTELYNKIRGTLVPFMLPTLLPLCYGGTVHVGFAKDPKFVMYTADEINKYVSKVTMIFDAEDIFCQDEFNVYAEDADEIDDLYDEAYMDDEAKRIEREAYRSQYGYAGESDDEDPLNPLNGVRFK